MTLHPVRGQLYLLLQQEAANLLYFNDLLMYLCLCSGCKIKALRAKTNTYIKTPVRGEEPVFVVTGRKEDVAMARREVQSAAEHFTQIRQAVLIT